MTDEAITAALNGVFDPCSVAALRPLGLVDMGLVLGWELRGTAVNVRICLTSGDCLMAPHFIEGARDRLLALDGIDSVEIAIDHDFLWSRDRMATRSTALERGDIQPYALRAAGAATDQAAAVSRTKFG